MDNYCMLSSRRKFCKYATIASLGLFTDCSAENALLTSEAIAPDIKPDQTLAFFGDSLTAGAGGTAYGKIVGKFFPGYRVVINAIGGQNSFSIVARQGGLPISISIKDNVFKGSTPVEVTEINIPFLSTNASAQRIAKSGVVAGVRCKIVRTVLNSSKPFQEVYTLEPEKATTQVVPAQSVFTLNDAISLRSAVQILWVGRNNTGKAFQSDITSCLEKSVDFLPSPKRFLILGVLTGMNDIRGSMLERRITSLNDTLAEKYGNHYVSMLAPTKAEMDEISFNPNEQDLAEIDGGLFPKSMRYDGLHLNNFGYEIVANRVIKKLSELHY
ncbi:SGNH/GDSL hydrolase family protein [Dyadobacter sp. Leaf189]|uniref:SGNH/GDSL hydrolase family protein n=1 Tax=Dyadobacter sp. Leaf189 TaxID=1736295 RepID=UPI000A8FBD78|nr:SGNH/GDSL hydrolase family protein [Dyadobacter sp. Leaf189]